MRDVTRAKIPSLCGAIWRTILNFYASQGVWVNCYYRIHQKSLKFIYPFKFYSNFTNKNVSWLHFSWATQYSWDRAALSVSRASVSERWVDVCQTQSQSVSQWVCSSWRVIALRSSMNSHTYTHTSSYNLGIQTHRIFSRYSNGHGVLLGPAHPW